MSQVRKICVRTLQGPYEKRRKPRTIVGRHGRGRSIGYAVGPGQVVQMFRRRPTPRTNCSSQVYCALRHRLAQGKLFELN